MDAVPFLQRMRFKYCKNTQNAFLSLLSQHTRMTHTLSPATAMRSAVENEGGNSVKANRNTANRDMI